MAEQSRFLGARIAAPLTFRSNRTLYSVDTAGLGLSEVSPPGQRWEVEFTAVPDSPGEFLALLDAAMIAGAEFPFAGFPGTPRPTALARNLEVHSSVVFGAATVRLKSLRPFTFPAGNFFRFDGHDKLYMSAATVSSSPSGGLNVAPAMAFTPPLTAASVGPSARVYHWNEDTGAQGSADRAGVTRTVSVDSAELPSLAFSDGILSSATVRVRERL